MFYKILNEENEVIQIGTGNTISSNAIEIDETEYNEILEEMMSDVPEEGPTEYEVGFNEGYEQAILDMLELELEEESEE